MAIPVAVAAVAVGLQALGMGADIIGGIRARKVQQEAERQAQEALDQAKQRIEVNRLEGLQVPLDAYEQAMRENTAQQMQALEGLREADPRALAAGVAKLGAAGAMATEKNRQQMADAIYSRDKMIAGEQANIDRMLANLSLQEAAGAQLAAADREQMAAQRLSSAIKGAGNIASSIYGMSDLYGSRQTELDAAKALQEQGLYKGMNPRQARRAMLKSGMFDKQAISNLASYDTLNLYDNELKAAKALQDQGMYKGMDTRQARRAMLDSGMYTDEQSIFNLIAYGRTPASIGVPEMRPLDLSPFQYNPSIQLP